jgi:hypothetical protein
MSERLCPQVALLGGGGALEVGPGGRFLGQWRHALKGDGGTPSLSSPFHSLTCDVSDFALPCISTTMHYLPQTQQWVHEPKINLFSL